MYKLRGEISQLVVPSDELNCPVAGHAHEPGGRIVGKDVNEPYLQCTAKCVLNHILRQFESAQAENPRQIRNNLSRFPAEKMIDQSGYVFRGSSYIKGA